MPPTLTNSSPLSPFALLLSSPLSASSPHLSSCRAFEPWVTLTTRLPLTETCTPRAGRDKDAQSHLCFGSAHTSSGQHYLMQIRSTNNPSPPAQWQCVRWQKSNLFNWNRGDRRAETWHWVRKCYPIGLNHHSNYRMCLLGEKHLYRCTRVPFLKLKN